MAKKKLVMSAEMFNASYHIGTPVKYFPIIGDWKSIETRTTSEAWTLGHGEAVVKVEGQAGGVSLRAIEVIPCGLTYILNEKVHNCDVDHNHYHTMEGKPIFVGRQEDCPLCLKRS